MNKISDFQNLNIGIYNANIKWNLIFPEVKTKINRDSDNEDIINYLIFRDENDYESHKKKFNLNKFVNYEIIYELISHQKKSIKYYYYNDPRKNGFSEPSSFNKNLRNLKLVKSELKRTKDINSLVLRIIRKNNSYGNIKIYDKYIFEELKYIKFFHEKINRIYIYLDLSEKELIELTNYLGSHFFKKIDSKDTKIIFEKDKIVHENYYLKELIKKQNLEIQEKEELIKKQNLQLQDKQEIINKNEQENLYCRLEKKINDKFKDMDKKLNFKIKKLFEEQLKNNNIS